MNLPFDRPLGKPEAATPRHSAADPRVESFARLVDAVDHRDCGGMLRETRELRKFGYSVCLTGDGAGKGGA